MFKFQPIRYDVNRTDQNNLQHTFPSFSALPHSNRNCVCRPYIEWFEHCFMQNKKRNMFWLFFWLIFVGSVDCVIKIHIYLGPWNIYHLIATSHIQQSMRAIYVWCKLGFSFLFHCPLFGRLTPINADFLFNKNKSFEIEILNLWNNVCWRTTKLARANAMTSTVSVVEKRVTFMVYIFQYRKSSTKPQLPHIHLNLGWCGMWKPF